MFAITKFAAVLCYFLLLPFFSGMVAKFILDDFRMYPEESVILTVFIVFAITPFALLALRGCYRLMRNILTNSAVTLMSQPSRASVAAPASMRDHARRSPTKTRASARASRRSRSPSSN